MSGTVAGGLKTKKTIIERHGSDWYKKIGKIGGKACVPKGFAANPELAKRAGSIGGKRSSRKGIKNGMGKSRYKYKKEWDYYETTQ